jgi:hypothetical protein
MSRSHHKFHAKFRGWINRSTGCEASSTLRAKWGRPYSPLSLYWFSCGRSTHRVSVVRCILHSTETHRILHTEGYWPHKTGCHSQSHNTESQVQEGPWGMHFMTIRLYLVELLFYFQPAWYVNPTSWSPFCLVQEAFWKRWAHLVHGSEAR